MRLNSEMPLKSITSPSGRWVRNKLVLPAVFLLILGFGNILVGTLKGEQYAEVINELTGFQPTIVEQSASPLLRIKHSKETIDRRYQRREKARARQDFYNLVTYTGEVLLTISILLLGLAFYTQSQKRAGTTPQS